MPRNDNSLRQWLASHVVSILIAFGSATTTAAAFSYHRGEREANFLTRDDAAARFFSKDVAEERFRAEQQRLARIEANTDTIIKTLGKFQ